MSTELESIQPQRSGPIEPELPPEVEQPVGEPSALGKGLLRPRTLISFAIAIAIFVFFIQRLDLDLAAVADNIRSANLILLASAIVVYVGTIVVRAARWRWMLVVAGAGTLPDTTIPPVGYLSAVLLVSWFFNCILPAKLGDAYRIYRVKVDDGIRYSIGFGTVLTERLIDLIVLVLMLTVSAIVAFHGDLPSDASAALYVGVGLCLLAVVGLVVIWFLRDQIEERLPLRFRNQWQTLQASVFVNLRQPVVPVVLSAIIWSMEASRVFLVAKALDVHISFELAIFVGLMAALLTTLPFTPAGLGVVEVATVAVLKLVDVPVDLAGSVALLDRLITYWGLIAIGAVVYLYMLKWGAHRGLLPTLPDRMAGATVIDISAAVNQRAGIGRYARELTRELIPLLAKDSTRLWFAADYSPANLELLDELPWNEMAASRSRFSRRSVDRLYFRARLPIGKLLGAGHPGDSYSPDFTTPPGRREHVTIHDLAWLHPEAQTSPGLALFLEPVVNRAIRRSATVFTVSETIRAEILERYGLSEERVVVAANAAAPHFFEAIPMPEQELVTLGVRPPFLLYVGTIEPRKNLPILLEAMARLHPELSLVVIGKNGWEVATQLERIDRLGLQERVQLLGFVSEARLARLYAAAAAVVYPSLYEGFGLPVVEGLAAGTPVVASDLPIFREVGGDAVTYFDPLDASSLVDAIDHAIVDAAGNIESRQRRQMQARRYAWNASAEVVSRRLQEVS